MENQIKNNPNYILAMDFINTHDLNSLENGKHPIDGENVFVNITDAELRPAEKARLEVHDKYIDLQIPLSGEESFGIKKRNDCTMPDGEMNTEKDILFFHDGFDEVVTVKPGEHIVFPPETAHAPLIGNGTIHKAIFKIKVQ